MPVPRPLPRPLAPALLLPLWGLRGMRLAFIPAARLARFGGTTPPRPRFWGNRRLQDSPTVLHAGGIISTSPLAKAMESPGFPDHLPLPPELSQGGGCVHIPSLGCKRGDTNLAAELVTEIEAEGDVLSLHRSRKHLQVFGEKLTRCSTFTAIVARLLMVFDLSLVDCWVNVYRHGGESKPAHHDNYHDREPTPTMTIGLSLGEPRELIFEHVKSGRIFRVLQNNGDVFAFDGRFNECFKHAVPVDHDTDSGLRVSIILWAAEGRNPAMPFVARRRIGAGVPQLVYWDRWDLEEGIWSPSRALVP